MESQDIKHSALLCKKCLENGEYIIPLYDKNELTKEIEYKCPSKHKNIKNDIIYMKIDENLKLKLTHCENHKKNSFCAWSENDSKNLCFMEIGEHLANKKNYELFMDIYPDTQLKEDMYFETIDSLNQLLKKYLDEFPKANKEINYLKEILPIIENSFCIFLKEEIVNYQTIKNVSFSIKIMPSKKEIESLNKQLLVYIYGDLITETTKKEIRDNEIKELYSDFEVNTKENKPEENNINIIPYIEENKQIFFTYYNNENFYNFNFYNINFYNISVYKIIGNNILTIHELQKKFKIDFIMAYNEKLILVLEKDKLHFVSFSEKYNEENIYSISIENILYNNNHNNNNNDNYFLPAFENHLMNNNNFGHHLQSTFYENQVIKINQNEILFLYKNEVYLIILNDESVKKSKFSRIDGLMVGRKKASSIYYRDNNIIKYGVIIATLLKEEFNYIKNRSGLFCIINMYDSNMEIIKTFDISIPNINIFGKIVISEIHYNFLNDMLLMFIDNKIYQIYLKTKTLVTIYDISKYNESKIRIFYNYDERKKVIEQIILLMNKNDGKIYLFNWEDKMIVFKKEYEYKAIIDFIPLYSPEIFNSLNEDKDIKFDKIFFHLNKGILYN